MQHLQFYSIIVCLLSLAFNANAQESTNSSGGTFLNSDGNVSFSVGQTVYTTYHGENGSIEQGVQQPYKISTITGLKNETIKLEFEVFPNPTNDYLKLTVNNNEFRSLNFQLIDINGNLINFKNIENKISIIEMKNLTSGIYFLKISNANTEIKTFKIIKQ